MENLDALIEAKEAAFIATVAGILSQNCTNRAKIALIYQQHIKCLVAIDDLVSAAKLQTPPGGEPSSV